MHMNTWLQMNISEDKHTMRIFKQRDIVVPQVGKRHARCTGALPDPGYGSSAGGSSQCAAEGRPGGPASARHSPQTPGAQSTCAPAWKQNPCQYMGHLHNANCHVLSSRLASQVQYFTTGRPADCGLMKRDLSRIILYKLCKCLLNAGITLMISMKGMFIQMISSHKTSHTWQILFLVRRICALHNM